MFLSLAVFIWLMVFEANAKISIHELCNGADENGLQLTDERINNTNIEQCTVCNGNQNENCHQGADYRELFQKPKKKDYFWLEFSINASQTGKTFCYFCISEYNQSSRELKFNEFNDMILIEYGKFDHYTNSTLAKWQIKNRRLSSENIKHRMIRMKNASGRISIISKNAIYVYQR